MRILILSFYYEPDLCAGSFRCTALVNELLKKSVPNLEVDVITTLPNRYSSYSADALQFEQRDNLSIHRVKLPTHKSGMLDQVKAFYFFYRASFRIIKNNDYDLVVATSSRLFTAFLGARIATIKRTPLYLDIRDIFLDTLKDVLSDKLSFLLMPFLRIIEKYTFSEVATVNLVSGGFLEYFHSRYPKLSYELYTNGIDNEFISASKDDSKYIESDTSVKTILYAGNIGEGQGLHRIIPDLASKLGNEFRILIIGDGGRKQQLVDALNHTDIKNVELIPPVSRDKLIKYYNRADILFLHLNDYEAFKKVLPSKIFEYAAFNKPMLAGVSGYAAEFIQMNIANSEVFPPCDACEAVRSIANLSYDGKLRQDFIAKFSRENIMCEMTESILSLVES